MKKTSTVRLSTLTIFVSLGLVACGGSETEFTKGTVNPTYPVSHNLDGGWTKCNNDIANGISGWEIIDIKGGEFSQYLYAFNTLNCTGALASKIKFTGTVEYQGQQVTSTCTAEKVNTTYTTLSVDDELQSARVLTALLQNLNLPNPDYDIACVYDDKFFVGARTSTEDGTTDSKRPTTLDLSNYAERI